LFPTKIRASAHGFCSAVGKCGALVGLFLLPIVQEQCGTSVTMLLMAFVCMLGLAVTSIFAQETRGRSLEDIEPGEAGITG
jgi:nitrate/nitrite transporter NarK